MTTEDLALYGEPLLSTLPKEAKTAEPKSTYVGGDLKIVRRKRPLSCCASAPCVSPRRVLVMCAAAGTCLRDDAAAFGAFCRGAQGGL